MAEPPAQSLTAPDAAALRLEDEGALRHLGSIARFAGPPPGIDALREHVRARLHLVPRYRQKLAAAPLGLGRARWVDDPRFNLEYHVRHTALPAPGDDAQLRRLAARALSQRLDRAKPLWELWVLEGLADDGWALVAKTHEALVDGLGSVDLTTTLFDVGAPTRGADATPGGVASWHPRPEPSPAQLTAVALTALAERAAALPLRVAAAATRPDRVLGTVRDAAGGVLRPLSGRSGSPVRGAVGPHRRVAHADARLDDFRTVRAAFGATVNDVVVATVAGGLRHWLHARGTRTEGIELRACVPVLTAGDLTVVDAPLPLQVADAVERLRIVRDALAGLKASRAALAARSIAALEDFAPPSILARAARLDAAAGRCDLLVANIPGPQTPLFLLGRRLEQVVPLAPLAGDRTLSVALISYDGGVSFGLVGDLDLVEDLDVLAEGLGVALAELVAAAAG